MKLTISIVTALFLASPAIAQLPASHPSVESARDEMASAEAQVHECERALQDRQSALTEISGMTAATPEAVRQLAEHLQTEKEALEVENAGAKGREDAIVKAIDQTTARVRARADADEVTRQLEAVVAQRQAQVDRVRQLQKAAAVAQAEVGSAEAALASARADLASARQKVSAPSTDLLEALNRELINLTIARQERSAKLQYIDNRLKQLAPALSEARNVERATHDLARAEHRRDAAIDQSILLTLQRGGR